MPTNLPMQMDPTSGLFCRSYFFKRLEEFLEQRAPQEEYAALLILSVSNYSIIFDAYGFEAADAAYSEVARRLNRTGCCAPATSSPAMATTASRC